MFSDISLEFLKQCLWDSSENSSESFPDFLLPKAIAYKIFQKALWDSWRNSSWDSFGFFRRSFWKLLWNIYENSFWNSSGNPAEILPNISAEFFQQPLLAYSGNLTVSILDIFENSSRLIEFFQIQRNVWNNSSGISRKISEKADNPKKYLKVSQKGFKKNFRNIFEIILETFSEKLQDISWGIPQFHGKFRKNPKIIFWKLLRGFSRRISEILSEESLRDIKKNLEENSWKIYKRIFGRIFGEFREESQRNLWKYLKGISERISGSMRKNFNWIFGKTSEEK